MEAAITSSLNWKPDVVHDNQNVENHDSESEVPFQDLLVDDVRGHSEKHPNRGEEPSEPALGENFCIRILDLERRDEEIGGSLLDARYDGDLCSVSPCSSYVEGRVCTHPAQFHHWRLLASTGHVCDL